MTDDANSDPSDPSNPSNPSTSTLKGAGEALLEGLPFRVGSTIAGKYRIDRVLGAGGMGIILAGHHVALDQRVAIKVLKPSALDNAEFVARFSREARAAARLRSEHVARVLDVGQSETGLPYMVMEYLSGKDLSRVVRERGPLPIVDATEYVIQACEGLAEAHRAGIVHRDLKPANLFLTQATDGTPLVKVLDFGISKLSNRPEDTGPSESLTQTQSMIGSPHYMSPEQLKSAKDVDARTDIWSLGGVLFKLLTSEPAFDGASTPELCVAILVGEPRDLRALRPDLPEALVQVVMKCLLKDPALRYPSVSELAHALAAFAPPHAATSVDRIARVGALAHPGQSPSDPPPLLRASTAVHEAADLAGPTVQGSFNVEMTTMTASASSVPADTKPSESVIIERKNRRLGTIIAIAGALGLVAVVSGVAITSLRGGTSTSTRASASGSGSPSGSASGASVSPSASGASVSTSASTSASASASASGSGGGHAAPRGATPTRAAATKPPAPPVAAPAPGPSSTSTVPDFGGRK
jgi:serine/threonine protein kinase